MILSLLLLMGMQAELWGRADCHPTTIVLDTAEWCGKSITLGKSSKKLSEIFPEECREPQPQPGLIGDGYEMLHPPEPLDVHAVPKPCHYEVAGAVLKGIVGDDGWCHRSTRDHPDEVDAIHANEELPPGARMAEPLDVPAIQHQTFHHCTMAGGSGNSPHLFDTSEIYKCDEGNVEIAGKRTMTIEYGYVYETELGRPSCEGPRVAAKEDYSDYKWCPTPQPWDRNQKEMCGDKPTKCFDGKPATWDPIWQGYSCATTDHQRVEKEK